MSKGIDYGLGTVNINLTTGIRYGVIPVNRLYEWIWEDFELDYGDPRCPDCGAENILPITELTNDIGFRIPLGCEYVCQRCKKGFLSHEVFPEEPLFQYIDKDGYQAEIDDYMDVFITESPYYTKAAFCSPCAPGACDLTAPCDDGERAYCFGHDHFDGAEAPYPVYRVSDNTLVPSLNK